MVALLPMREVAPIADSSKVIFALMVCGAPLAFGGLACAPRFAVRRSAQNAFGWNIIGAVMGGFLELLSMLTGLGAMFCWRQLPTFASSWQPSTARWRLAKWI